MTRSIDVISVAKDLMHVQQAAVPDQRYLLGLRGVLVIQSFTWLFLHTFVPTTVRHDIQNQGPYYQDIIRKSLSVIFWNEALIASTFILLSARTTCLPFLKKSSKTSIASACFRRGLRLWFPVAVALAIVKAIFSSTGTDYIEEFKEATANASLATPYPLRGALAYFNSVFGLFWTTFNFATQAGSKAFPSGTLWIVNVIYAQSYTVYMTMVIIPFTRNRWRVEAFALFIITAWWVQSWAWYTITGLLLADAVMNMDFKARAQRRIPIWKTSLRCPTWIISGLLMAAGLVMQYIWTAWRPEMGNVELIGHAGLYYTGGLNTEYDLIQPQARDDNYVFLLGFFLFLESSEVLQRLLDNRLLTYLGSRSLSKLPFPARKKLGLPSRLLSRPKYHRLHSMYQALPCSRRSRGSTHHHHDLSAYVTTYPYSSGRGLPSAGGLPVTIAGIQDVRLGTSMSMNKTSIDVDHGRFDLGWALRTFT